MLYWIAFRVSTESYPVHGFISGRGGGALMEKRKREETKGHGRLFPRENFKFKSSEMAINASKTANSNINL